MRIRPPGRCDALLIVDVQEDFLPGGALARMRASGAIFASTRTVLAGG